MDPKILNKTHGPLTNYLRSNSSKKKSSKSIMSGSLPKITVSRDDRNTVNIRNPVSLDKIDILSDSGSSAKSIPRKIQPQPKTPQKMQPRREVPKMRESNFNPDELQYFVNNQKHKPVVERADPEEESEMDEEDDYESEEYDQDQGYDNYEDDEDDVDSEPRVSNKELERRKREMLVKLAALENKGVELTKKFSVKSRYEDIEFEYETQKKELETQAGVKFQQKALMAFVTGVEFMNNKFDPIGAKLDGWSESVMDSMNDYDSVFRRLYEKYATKSDLPPELELLMTLVASGFMFHLTNSLFKSNMPAVGNILQSNPDIMKNIAAAMGGLSPQQTQQPQQPRQQKEMSGPSLNLSSLINNNSFNKVGPPPPQNTVPEKETDRFSIASSDDSAPISTISKSGKKTITIN